MGSKAIQDIHDSSSQENEQNRLSALHKYAVFSTPSKREFNVLVNLVTEICKVSFALINLLDERRQWLKAKVGFGEIETSFCHYTIQSKHRMVVRDIRLDKRSAHNTMIAFSKKFHTLKPRDEIGGSGPGLSMVKKIIEQLSGSVEVVSDGQIGTTILVK